ncbi:hypothetical protein Ac2012v2_007931 [Leucoagaricus gongylophorus]
MSPSPNSPPTNITYSLGSTTSQAYKVTEKTSKFATEVSRHKSRTPVSSSLPASEYPQQASQQYSVKLHSSVDPQEESSTMAFSKRPRRAFPALQQRESQEPISPSSDSQTADNENDHIDTKGKGVGPPQSDSASVKKKRTRTLTTPHQASVLHSLLAQNQRQKARRPRREPDESAPLSPRYGPFPAYVLGDHSSSFPAMTVPSSTQNTLLLSSKYNAPVQQPYGQPQHLSEPSSDSSAMERPCRLLGPAYPGVDLYGSSYHGQPRSQRAIASRAAPTNTSDSSGSSSQLYSPLLRPIHRAAAVLGTTHAQNNRTLPPLSFDITSPSGNTIVSGGLQRRPPFITLPPPESCRSRQRSSVSPQGPHFATQVPDSSGHPRAILSPPFALQPEPRWDSSSFSTNLRPTIFATARRNTVSSVFRMHDESIDSIQNRGVVEGHSESTVLLSTSEAESTTPLIREGRYDPVRETFIPCK